MSEKRFTIRSARVSDHKFILASWQEGIYYGAEEIFLPRSDKGPLGFRIVQPGAIAVTRFGFNRLYPAILEGILKDANTEARVACLPDDEDVILGYALFGIPEVLHWIFVKQAWRRFGIAVSLVDERQISTVSHMSQAGYKLMKKIPGAKFEPF